MKSPMESSPGLWWRIAALLQRSAPVRYLRALSSSARITLALLAGLVVAVFGLSAFSDPPPQVEGEPEPIPVVVQAAEPRALAPEIHVFGRVENPNTTTLRASTLAYVSEVKVREGQAVAAGDVLLRLDDRDAQLSVKRAEAALIEARGELERLVAQQNAEVKNAANQRQLLQLTVRKQERFRTLFSNGQISATDYDALEQQRLEMEMALNGQDMLLASHEAQRAGAEARVARAEADWQESRLNLERLTLRAPFDGTIIRVDAARGARLVAGQEVVTLFDQASQRVRVSLPERDARLLRRAQERGAAVEAVARVSDSWTELQLLDIGAQVRAGRAGTDVMFAVPDDGGLALGRAVDVKITLPAEQGLIDVPLQGVYADRFIYTISEGVLEAVEVERVGVREDAEGNTRLLLRAPALAAGDPVVVSALSRATSGTRVAPLGAALSPDPAAVSEAVAAR
jgi:multidrug efflux pump subunit AcrA (membrane-fusion protein)